MGLDMLVNDIGRKPVAWGASNPVTDQLALIKRSSCPSAYQSFWNGPYVQNYPVEKNLSLITTSAYGSNEYLWYYYSWPQSDVGEPADSCGTGFGMLFHTQFISVQAKTDIVAVLLGRTFNYGSSNNWLYYCGFHDDRQVTAW
jgi:hypothetical protein